MSIEPAVPTPLKWSEVPITFSHVDQWTSFSQPGWCRMDLPGPTTSVGTRTDYSVGPWDYPTCAALHLLA
jgi:hypothetical protein